MEPQIESRTVSNSSMRRTRIDFDAVRALVERTEREAPFEVERQLPIIKFEGEEPGEQWSCTILTPQTDGKEFEHWRFLREAGLIRVARGTEFRVLGLRAKGYEFFELSRNEEAWDAAKRRCDVVQANTLTILVGELRREARSRLLLVNSKE